MIPRRDRLRCINASLLALTCGLVLGACASPGPVSALDPEYAVIEGKREFDTPAGEAGYHLLLAEMALAREMGATATEEYARAAALSPDPAIAARATRVAFELGDEAAALRSARRWLALEPESNEPHRVLASLYLRRGALDAAHTQFTYLVAHLSDTPGEAFGPISAILMLEPDAELALAALERLAGAYPDVAEGQYALATQALRAQRLALAVAAARRAVALSPDWSAAGMLLARTLVLSGDEEEGLATAAAILENETDTGMRLEHAVLLATAGRDLEARSELDAILAVEPQLPSALRAAGVLALRANDLDQAERHFTSLLASGTQTLAAFYLLAQVADGREEPVRAFRLYSRVQAGEYAVPAQVRAAQILHEQGRTAEALAYLQRFGEANPRFAMEMVNARGNLLRAAGDTDAALALYDAALEERPGDEALLYARAFLYEDLDRVDDAVAELRVLVERNPEDATALNALGYTLADRTTRYREAYRLIRKALELDPQNPAIIDSMGWVEYRRGRHSRAIEHLQRAYSMVPDPEIAAHLGEVLWVSGDVQAAQTVWYEALAREPGSEILEEVIRRFVD